MALWQSYAVDVRLVQFVMDFRKGDQVDGSSVPGAVNDNGIQFL